MPAFNSERDYVRSYDRDDMSWMYAETCTTSLDLTHLSIYTHTHTQNKKYGGDE